MLKSVKETGFSKSTITNYVEAGKQRFQEERLEKEERGEEVSIRYLEELYGVSAEDLKVIRPVINKVPIVYEELLKARARGLIPRTRSGSLVFAWAFKRTGFISRPGRFFFR